MIDRRNRQVLASLEDANGLRCVDIYLARNGEIFWDEWRRDPEDPSGWHATGRRSAKGLKNKAEARNAACRSVEWLSD